MEVGRKIDTENLVDVVGGTQKIDEWMTDILHQYLYRKPEVLILDLKKCEDGRYKGYLYITQEDFNHERFRKDIARSMCGL